MKFEPRFPIVRLVDIDGVVFRQFTSVKIVEPELLPGSFERINAWFDAGDHIVFFSARSPEYYELTMKQLDSVGLKYHRLILGKPLGGQIHLYDDADFHLHLLKRNEGLEGIDE